MDSMIVYQHTLHLEVGLFTVLLVFKLDECILQTVAGAFIPNDLAGEDGPKTTEDQM